jgi:hypothetical protein
VVEIHRLEAASEDRGLDAADCAFVGFARKLRSQSMGADRFSRFRIVGIDE